MAIITLFGKAGTGTSSTGKALAKDLGYEFISTGVLFRKKAESMGMDLYQFEAYCSEHPEFNTQYNNELDEEIRKLGVEKDNFVIDSWLAWHFIPTSFKVKLVCDFDIRTERVARRDGVSLEKAKEKTLYREESLTKRYMDLYHFKEYAPDAIFDIIIDTTTTPLHQVVSRIKSALK